MSRLSRVLLLVLILCPVKAICDSADDLSDHVVQIYNHDNQLIGTGTVLNTEGLILTAKHVFFDPNLPTIGEHLYLLTSRVKFRDSDSFIEAELIAVHPYLDLAILRVVGKHRTPLPTKVDTDFSVAQRAKEAVVIGHVQATGEVYRKQTGPIDDTDRNGYIVFGRDVRKGTSGGPVFVDDRLIGVVSTTGNDSRTYATPIARGTGYFALAGIFFINGAALSANVADLAAALDRQKTILADIEQDLLWKARLSERKSDGDTSTNDLELEISLTRKLRIQPELTGKVVMRAAPLFSNPAFLKLKHDERLWFLGTGRIKKGSVRFTDIRDDIEGKIAEYHDRRQVSLSFDELSALDVKASIVQIRENKNPLHPPEALSICFTIPFSKDVRAAEGAECTEDADNVNVK